MYIWLCQSPAIHAGWFFLPRTMATDWALRLLSQAVLRRFIHAHGIHDNWVPTRPDVVTRKDVQCQVATDYRDGDRRRPDHVCCSDSLYTYPFLGVDPLVVARLVLHGVVLSWATIGLCPLKTALKRDTHPSTSVCWCRTVRLSQTGAVGLSMHYHCKRLETARSQHRSCSVQQ